MASNLRKSGRRRPAKYLYCPSPFRPLDDVAPQVSAMWHFFWERRNRDVPVEEVHRFLWPERIIGSQRTAQMFVGGAVKRLNDVLDERGWRAVVAAGRTPRTFHLWGTYGGGKVE